MRNYRKEYDNYHSRPEQKIRRAARNAARRRFADADPNKDVHHKDNNPLNNDKNNLSLVTQHYNRREPRLRKEDAASRAKEIADLRAKHADEIAKEREDRNKERETADKEEALLNLIVKISEHPNGAHHAEMLRRLLGWGHCNVSGLFFGSTDSKSTWNSIFLQSIAQIQA